MFRLLTLRMTARLLTALPFIGSILLTQSAIAAPECPYEAVVRTSEVDVRSGPGQRYYVTGRVQLDDRVTVHRHDPGGWYMIAPPSGSFSWITTDQVRRTGDSTGVVEVAAPDGDGPGRAVVRIGSEYSDEHTFYGRELSTGDEVQILGEQTLNTADGAVRMYKIAPPPLEYRWVKGDFIVPVDGRVAAKTIRDPLVQPVAGFEVDPEGPTVTVEEDADPFAAVQMPAPADAAAGEVPTTAPLPIGAGVRETMQVLDGRYLELIRQSPDQWDLDGLVNDYQALRSVADADLTARVDERIAALESRRQVWEDYREFVRISRETSERDAALVAMQTGVAPVTTPPTGEIKSESRPTGPQLPAADGSVPQVESSTTVEPSLSRPPSASTPAHPGDMVGLSGAGVIQRMPTGPQGYFVHVLTDPQGKILAILRPAAANVPLDQHVGQAMGVVGRRYFDAGMSSDVIQVQQILPVRLAP